MSILAITGLIIVGWTLLSIAAFAVFSVFMRIGSGRRYDANGRRI